MSSFNTPGALISAFPTFKKDVVKCYSVSRMRLEESHSQSIQRYLEGLIPLNALLKSPASFKFSAIVRILSQPRLPEVKCARTALMSAIKQITPHVVRALVDRLVCGHAPASSGQCAATVQRLRPTNAARLTLAGQPHV